MIDELLFHHINGAEAFYIGPFVGNRLPGFSAIDGAVKRNGITHIREVIRANRSHKAPQGIQKSNAAEKASLFLQLFFPVEATVAGMENFAVAVYIPAFFFIDEGNRPGLGQAFIVIDPGALAGRDNFLDRVEELIAEMLKDESVRLPGARREALRLKMMSDGFEVSDEMLSSWKTF